MWFRQLGKTYQTFSIKYTVPTSWTKFVFCLWGVHFYMIISHEYLSYLDTDLVNTLHFDCTACWFIELVCKCICQISLKICPLWKTMDDIYKISFTGDISVFTETQSLTFCVSMQLTYLCNECMTVIYYSVVGNS